MNEKDQQAAGALGGAAPINAEVGMHTNPVRNEVLEELFKYHAPTGNQPEKYTLIRAAAKALAYVIDECCEPGPDRTAAIRHVREAMMTANASIATGNAQYR